MMDRRAFLGTVAGALVASPLRSEAQQARVYRVGVVHQGGAYSGAVDGLRKGLADLGLDEGKQIILHVHDGQGDPKTVEKAAGDLERGKVDLIYAVNTSVTVAVKQATRTIPVVFYVGVDPVDVGLVESFRKPGGRFTGIYSGFVDLSAKRLEILKEMVPKLRRVVTFYRPDNPQSQRNVKVARDAARQLKVELLERRFTSVDELRTSLRALRAGEVDAFYPMTDGLMISQTALVIETARVKRLPLMLSDPDSVVKGGLAGYGVSYFAVGRLAARYVQRILLGANPGDLPVEQVDRLYFVINLKTAEAIGLTVPQSVLQRADEVIQ